MNTEPVTGKAKIQKLKPSKPSPSSGHYSIQLQFPTNKTGLFACFFWPLEIHVYTFRLHIFQEIISVPREPFWPHYRSWGRQETIWYNPKAWDSYSQDQSQLSAPPQRAETIWPPCLLIWPASTEPLLGWGSRFLLVQIKQEQAEKCWQTWPLGTCQDLQTKIAGGHWPHSQVG